MPLIRFVIMTQGSEKFLVWTYLQAVVDRWTKRLIFHDLGEYIANSRSFTEDVAVRPPVRSIVDHIVSIDEAAALAFWDRRLEGLKNTDILFDSKQDHEPVSVESSRIIEDIPFSYEGQTRHPSHLENHASPPITYSTIAHVAWALTIGKVTGLDDIFFVSKRSGRQCTLRSVDSVMAR